MIFHLHVWQESSSFVSVIIIKILKIHYTIHPDFGIEFVNTIKQFNTEIMDDPNYAALLNVFNVNLNHSTGSRAVKRFVGWIRKNFGLSS